MELQEVNTNVMPLGSRGNKPTVMGKEKAASYATVAPSATFICPPRNLAAAAAAALRNSKCVPPSSSTSRGALPVPSVQAKYNTGTPYTPEQLHALAEASYMQCPCAPCAYYRMCSGLQKDWMRSGVMTGGETHRFMATLPHPHVTIDWPARGPKFRNVAPVPVMSLTRDSKSFNANVERFPLPHPHFQLPVPAPEKQMTVTPSETVRQRTQARAGGLPEKFFCESRGRVAELACSTYGKSALISAIRTHDADVIAAIVDELCVSLELVAVHPEGCHVVRSVMEVATAEQTSNMVSALRETLILNLCTISQHTRRILQVLFERRQVNLQPVLIALSRNANYLAATQHGCISLMRIYELSTSAEKPHLIKLLVPTFAYIAFDPYGNYVIQCVLEHGDKADVVDYIMGFFPGRLLQMSCNKFASNVVERLILHCGDIPAVRQLLLDELVFNANSLHELVNDSYGNFVIQSIVASTVHPTEFKRICECLRPALTNCPNAGRIEAKIKAQKIPCGITSSHDDMTTVAARQVTHLNCRPVPLSQSSGVPS